MQVNKLLNKKDTGLFNPVITKEEAKAFMLKLEVKQRAYGNKQS